MAKKDGTTCFCIDYRKLNEVTVKDAYPLSNINECLDSLAGSCFFSVMDLCSGYWQIEMDPADKEKTAFSSKSGLYQFTVMPFGLTNAQSCFERLMETVLRGLQWEQCLIFLDDVVVFGACFQTCLERLIRVFERFKSAGLKLKPSKCSLFQKEILFLGHVVSEEGIHTDPIKTKAVRDWPQPKNVKEVRGFLGLCSYYRKFVKNFADIARPLHRLTEKDIKFIWTEECEGAFVTLKVALTSAPILAYPVASIPFILDTDASGQAVAGVLSQVQEGKEKVIAYLSILTREERRYCVNRKELLAVVTAVKNFKHYIYGQPIRLPSDNAAVSWMFHLKNPEGQMVRWLQFLGQYDLKPEHRAGRKHVNADALSRRPCKQCGRMCESEELESTLEFQESRTCVVTRRNKESQQAQLKSNQGWLKVGNPMNSIQHSWLIQIWSS